MARDRVFEAFLTRQHEDGLALAGSSDLFDLAPLEPRPSSGYIARFHCRGLVDTGQGRYEEADRFDVGIRFPEDYLRRSAPMQVLTFLGPRNTWHPNISPPFICVGRLGPGTPLVDLLYQCFEIITYNKVTPREDDALNLAACAWARNHQALFPVDRRPLKRRGLPTERRPRPEAS